MDLELFSALGARLWLMPSYDNLGFVKFNYRCNIAIGATKSLIE
jgi:hypothetical protein